MGNLVTAYVVLDDSYSEFILDSNPFNLIYCGYVELNPTTYRPVIPRSKLHTLTTFPAKIKEINANVKTLLSIGNINGTDVATFAGMVTFSSRRRNFIATCIELAREYNYDGFELHWLHPSTATEMSNLGLLLREWREAIGREFTLAMTVSHSPSPSPNVMYPSSIMESCLDWINVGGYDFYTPETSPLRTGPSHAFFNPDDKSLSGEFGLEEWIKVFPHEKIIYSYSMHGWAWRLKNGQDENVGLFETAEGPAISPNGFVEHALTKYGKLPEEVFDKKFLVRYIHLGNTWITYEAPFEDKLAATLEKYGLLGTYFYHAKNDGSYPRDFINKAVAEWKKMKEEKKV